MKEPPTYYETIVNSKIWNEWREHQEKTLEFDIVESIECGYLSDKHWQAFIKWIESRPMQENATSMQNEEKIKPEELMDKVFGNPLKQIDDMMLEAGLTPSKTNEWEEDIHDKMGEILKYYELEECGMNIGGAKVKITKLFTSLLKERDREIIEMCEKGKKSNTIPEELMTEYHEGYDQSLEDTINKLKDI